MKRPDVFEGVLFALLASIGASLVYAALTWLLARSGVLYLIITAVMLAYVLYLLLRSREKVGRISTLVIWCGIALVLWLLAVPLPVFVLAHLGMLWLIRSLYFHTSIITILLDLGLNGLSLLAASWALGQTQSLFLSVWCFFLVQALFVKLPQNWRKSQVTLSTDDIATDNFEQAHRLAQAALRKLVS